MNASSFFQTFQGDFEAIESAVFLFSVNRIWFTGTINDRCLTNQSTWCRGYKFFTYTNSIFILNY